MEKLIQYLNQHRIELCNWNTTNLIKFKYSPYTFNIWDLWEQNTELLVISKQYWFIKRLYDNKKIDFDKLEDNWDWYYIDLRDNYLEILALLSIQENPIEFLFSILK